MDVIKLSWSPALTLGLVVISVVSILDDFYPHDAVNTEAGKLYLNDKEQFKKMAK